MTSGQLALGRARVRLLGPPKPPVRPRWVLSCEARVRKAEPGAGSGRAEAQLGMRAFGGERDTQVKESCCH